MGVRVRDQLVGVQTGDSPVHLGVRTQSGFHGANVWGEVGIAVRDRVETRLRTERGEPRRPDVRGHQEAVRACLERDLEQVSRVQSENGSTIRAEVGTESVWPVA